MKLVTPRINNIQHKVCIVRVDYNVPLKKRAGSIQVVDDRRIKNSIETINFLVEGGAKVILISHLGRPGGKPVEKLSLAPICKHLKTSLKLDVEFVRSDISKLEKDYFLKSEAKIFLLENIRFYPGEQLNEAAFAKKIASLGDVYINEAFSNSHRSHASIVGLPKFLPHFAGFGLQKEVEILAKIISHPKRPLVIVVGGAKISDKVAAIENLAKIADMVLVGGGVANNFLKAEGLEIHKSYLQDVPSDLKKKGVDFVDFADDLIEKYRSERALTEGYIPLPKIIYPIDVVAAKNADSKATEVIDLTHDMQDTPNDKDLMYLDIGPKTSKLFSELISRAGSVFWNGPMGVFEHEKFANGSKRIAHAIANSNAQTLVGGGDTIAIIDKLKIAHKIDVISTAGGAALELLAGHTLVGLSALF